MKIVSEGAELSFYSWMTAILHYFLMLENREGLGGVYFGMAFEANDP